MGGGVVRSYGGPSVRTFKPSNPTPSMLKNTVKEQQGKRQLIVREVIEIAVAGCHIFTG